MLSQNGYTVIQRDDCTSYDVVPGLSLPLRPDDCGYLMADFARRYHKDVEPLGVTETFGHAYRQISGSDEWSNHASGTGLDTNSAQHPYGQQGTFTATELSNLEKLLEDYDGVIRWGGTFRTTKDEMHYEIDKPYEAVSLLARVVKRNGQVSLSRLKPGNRNIDVYMVKRLLSKRGLFDGNMNNYFGKALQAAYAKWQESLGYTDHEADGIPGVVSIEALGLTVKEN